MRLLEICVDDPAGLEAAVEGGADRIELCAALALGGLTPSPGLMREAAGCGRPVMAMIRPRAGGFDWSGAELRAMLGEVEAAGAAGLAGVVIGATLGGRLDLEVLGALVTAAGAMEVTLHRCVDLLADPVAAVDQAVALGIARILSSGGAVRVLDGLDRLAAMEARAAGRCRIMPGSGVTPETLPAILARLEAAEVHASASVPASPGPELIRLGFAPEAGRRTDAATVRRLRRALDG